MSETDELKVGGMQKGSGSVSYETEPNAFHLP